MLCAVLSGKIRNGKKTTMFSGTVEHKVRFYSSQAIATDDNIQNYVLVGQVTFAVELCELAQPLE